MKKFIALAVLSLLFITSTNAQWCQNPDPSFCPGNLFTNGDFESVSGDPDVKKDQDINLATGWGSIFTTGYSPTNADIACASSVLCNNIPTPNTGGIHSGMWIQNSSSSSPSNFREQMYNTLTSSIAANTGMYTFNCKIAADCQNNTSTTIDIAVYGIYNPTNALATNSYTGLYTPADVSLWSTPGVQVVLLGTITTPPGLGLSWQNISFTFNSNILPTNGITHIMITRSPTPSATYKKKYIMFDEFCMQVLEDVPTKGCCDELENSNLIINGSFENGNLAFDSDYDYQSVIASNSVTLGQYTIGNGDDANTISNCWDITDHTTCVAEEGNMMLVNGRTNVAGSTATVYEQTNIAVDQGEEYIFCMYYQQLSQCAFDAFDPSNISVVFDGVDAEDIVISDCEDEGQNDCGWTKISYTITPNSNSIDISILLDESVAGDGNDVAFDDLSLRKKEDMPAGYCDFIVSAEYEGSEMFITANAVTNPLPTGFDVTWTVVEIDCNTGLPIPGTEISFNGDPYSTNFHWYLPFYMGKCYHIIREVSSCCYKGCHYEYYIGEEGVPGASAKPSGSRMNKDATGSNLKVFPNPGDGYITLNAQQSLSGAQLTVYSTDGKIVLKQLIQKEHNANIDLSTVPNGVYSFKVTLNDGKVINQNYIKQ